MKKPVFTGASVAIVTPFTADNKIHFEEFGRIIDFQIENGTDAITVCGTTGESACMTDDEHRECIEYCIDRVAGRVPVIAGTGSNDTAYAIELSKHAAKAGADALLLVTPYYNKATQKGLIKHYNMIADAVDIPCMLYNVPSRTGCGFTADTYKELSKHPNIVAAKEANGNITSIARTRALCGDNLDIYSGNDDQIIPVLSLGGKGVISVLSNVAPQQTHDMCQLFFEGKTAEAAAMQIKMMGLVDALFADVNPIPVKKAMNMLGWKAGPCRLPLVEPDDKVVDLLRTQMTRCGISK